ncbi:hypothetical protein ACFFQW_49180 [Umezawaea endophytica]|uniref:Uncharacterized protein n=1 Tax=Umezawaea endophytica TaxID=1654476 RepID=A0A9X3AJY8_9PSEU|nr:hypothetical protein [Umezawaea endophytica]MCS7484681.1 hypothetical protein [Umezawaea endophytica]
MISAAAHGDAEAARQFLGDGLVAEELSTGARELVVAWLHGRGLTDAQIATRTHLSTYTAARIRARLRLPAHHAQTGGSFRGA